MPRKIPGVNQGPEVYDPEVLRVESSRSEREQMTRFTDGRVRQADNRRKAMRILLLDILLLCIIGGVIYPFLAERNRSGSLGECSYRLELRRSDEDVLISLRLKSSSRAEEGSTVAVRILADGKELESLEDLIPPAGETRRIRYRLKSFPERVRIEALIESGGESLKLNALSSAAE